MTDANTAAALLHFFGHAPDEPGGEKWTVYEDKLIVIHPARRPKVFAKGCQGRFYEIELAP